MSSGQVLVRGVRSVVGLSLRLVASVDEAAERVDGVQQRVRQAVSSRLPAPRPPAEHEVY